MTTTTIKRAARSFFTLRPIRDYSIRTKTAVLGSIALVATQIGDATTTIIGMGSGAAEANSLMATVIQEHGYAGFVGIKLAAAALLVWFSWRRRFAPWTISFLYLGVILWNLHIISKLS